MNCQNETVAVSSVTADVPQPPQEYTDYLNNSISQAEPPVKAEKKKIPPLEIIDGNSLMDMSFAPLQFAIDRILPEGIFILAGSPKSGKSWLALEMLTAVATGGKLWDFPASKGSALYLALEDNHRRLQSRLTQQDTAIYDNISNLHLNINALNIHGGLTSQINGFLNARPDTRLVVIDTLERIRDREEKGGNTYAVDYKDMTALRAITTAHRITLLLIHHTRKMYDPDPLNQLSGSTGLVGAVDGVWVLEKESRAGNEAKLTIANRDTEGFCYKLEFCRHSCRWNFCGDYVECQKDDDSVLTAVDCFMLNISDWSGTATELLAELKKINPAIKATPATLAKKLRKQAGFLKSEYGVIADLSERTGDKKTITLSRKTENDNAG